MTSPAYHLLKTVFGYERFKPLQEEIISSLLAKKDALVVMPTGGGKSLCYQIPALLFPGITLVVSPLISLMKDQVEQLKELGIPAVFLNSSLSFEEYRANTESIRRGEVRLVYVAPETLLTPRFLDLFSNLPVDCLAVDEAHCISEWGHDFRPEYRQIADVRKRFSGAVCVALTATATPRVRQDIKTSLGFGPSSEFIASFNRENLYLEVTPKSEPTYQTIQFIRSFPNQSGIIYCFSRKQVEELASRLAQEGFSVRPYHAGLLDEERKRNQELFIRDDVQIIVATIAFGMGINKPNVRFVVHYDLPKSIESYYQEIGRSGRDGLPAHCLLLFGYADIQKIKYFIQQKEGSERQVAKAHLDAMVRYAEASLCRRAPLMQYFGEPYRVENCGMCNNCRTAEIRQVDITTPSLMFLSCVKRTGEIFGANHVIDVLLGAENEKVRKNGHQALSTYGIGKEYTRQQWISLSRQLLHKELLLQDDEYGSLKLTPQAYELFKNRQPVMGILEEEVRAETPVGKGARKGEAPQDYDRKLFDILRQKRKDLADAAHLPPYVIFSDRTLIEMAAYYPQATASLTQIFGIGRQKLEKYGPLFLEIISAYCREARIQERPKHRASRSRAERSQVENAPRHIQVGNAYNAGRTVEQIAAEHGIQGGTVLSHLAKFLLEGHSLRDNKFLNLPPLAEEQHTRILKAFADLGTEYLKPVFEALDGAVSYDDLKRYRLEYLILIRER